jgi:putative membrane protein
MPSGTKLFFQRWIITTVAVLVAANVVPGIHYENPTGLLVASLLLGILNAFLRPVMLLLALPLLIFTLGFFVLVINAALLYFVGWLVSAFHVQSFAAAFFGGVVISIVSLLVNWMLGTGNMKVEINRGRRPPPRSGGNGPVIDV